MEITPNGTVFLLSHRGGIAPEADSLILELTIALTKENAIAGKGEVFRLTFPANHAEKIISSIQTALQRLRRSH